MYTTFLLYYSSSKFSKFIEGKSRLLQQLASVSLLNEKSKFCPKLIELSSWNGPTFHVCCFMLARASTKTFVSRMHIRQPSPKTAKKSLLAEKFLAVSPVSRGITVVAFCKDCNNEKKNILLCIKISTRTSNFTPDE